MSEAVLDPVDQMAEVGAHLDRTVKGGKQVPVTDGAGLGLERLMALDSPGDHLTEDLSDRAVSRHRLEGLPCRVVDFDPSGMRLLVADCS